MKTHSKRALALIGLLSLLLPPPCQAFTAHVWLTVAATKTLTTPGYQLYQDGSAYGSHITTGISYLTGLYYVQAAQTLPDGHTYAVSFDDGGTYVGSGVVLPDPPSSTNPVIVGTNNDKTGYAVSTVSDKTGYSLSASGLSGVTIPSVTVGGFAGGVTVPLPSTVLQSADLTAIWAAGTRTLTAQSDTPGTGTLLTRLGTPTGASVDADVMSRLSASSYVAPANPATVTLSAGDETRLGNLDAAISSRQASGAAVTLPPTAPLWYTAPPPSPPDYLSTAEQTYLAKLDATVSSRLAASAYVVPTNADTSGVTTLLARVGTPAGASVSADIAGVKSDTAGIVTSQAAQSAALATVSTGVTSANAALAGIPAAVLARSIGHGMTVGQLLVLLQSTNGAAAVTNTWDPVGHVLTTTYQFAGDGAPVRSDATNYPNTQTAAPPVIGRTTTLGTLPQP